MNPRRLFVWVMLLGLLTGIGLTRYSFAQATATPVPTPTPIDFEAYNRLFATVRIPMYEAAINDDQRIVYALDSASVPEDLIIAPNNLQAIFPKVLIAESQADLIDLHEQMPLHALILHVSALTWIDPDWVHYQYLNGTPLITIDMTFSQSSPLLSSGCDTVVDTLDWSADYARLMGHTTTFAARLFYPSPLQRGLDYADFVGNACQLPAYAGGSLTVEESAGFIREQADLQQAIDMLRVVAARYQVELTYGPLIR